MEKDELIEKCSALISSLDNIKWKPIDFPRKNENGYGHHDLILDGGSMYHQLKMAKELLYEAILAIEKQPNLDNIVAHKITEEPCKIYNPQGNLICDCDNELTFLDILCQIKRVQCEGYYVIKNDLKYKINADGTVDTKAKPQLFTKYEKIHETIYNITIVDREYIYISDWEDGLVNSFSFHNAYELFTFMDDESFGIKEI